MKRRRVKITGIGCVTPAGIGRLNLTNGIMESVSRVGVLEKLNDEAGVFVGAGITNFKLSNYVDRELPNKLPRHTQFAIAAASLAICDAGIGRTELANKSVLIVTGTSLMDGESVIKSIAGVATKGPRHGLMRTVQHGPVGGIPNYVARALGLAARTLVVSTSCCAGMDAIGVAYGMVASGEVDLAICGGTEAPLNLHPLLEMKMAGLAPGNSERPGHQSRPFDLWRTTGVIGEGASLMVLEGADSPRTGYAMLSGYAFALDENERQPGCGLLTTARLALANANLASRDIDTISAWGPGHRLIDAVESNTLAQLIGGRLEDVPVTSIKGAIGNPLAAAGAMQVSCAAIGMKEGFLPPTVNWEFPDPDCPLNLSSKVRFIQSCVTLVNSHGLSGTNSSIVLTKCQ
jgi:3-oxoacyl-(acyl-carrier-protein) synthase